MTDLSLGIFNNFSSLRANVLKHFMNDKRSKFEDNDRFNSTIRTMKSPANSSEQNNHSKSIKRMPSLLRLVFVCALASFFVVFLVSITSTDDSLNYMSIPPLTFDDDNEEYQIKKQYDKKR